MDMIVEFFSQADTDMQQATSLPVQIWMNWMMLVFAFSIVFVWTRVSARYVLLTLLLSMPVSLVIYWTTGNVHLLGLSHILLWLPLLLLLWKRDFRSSADFRLTSFYGIWLTALSATIIVSLVFDVRDVILVVLGMK